MRFKRVHFIFAAVRFFFSKKTCISHCGDHKGAAFPFEEITAHQGTELTTRQFPGSNKSCGRHSYYSTCEKIQPITNISLATPLHADIAMKWCVLPKLLLNYSLFATKFHSMSSEVRHWSLTEVFSSCILPKRGLEGECSALQAAVALPYYVKNPACSEVG